MPPNHVPPIWLKITLCERCFSDNCPNLDQTGVSATCHLREPLLEMLPNIEDMVHLYIWFRTLKVTLILESSVFVTWWTEFLIHCYSFPGMAYVSKVSVEVGSRCRARCHLVRVSTTKAKTRSPLVKKLTDRQLNHNGMVCYRRGKEAILKLPLQHNDVETSWRRLKSNPVEFASGRKRGICFVSQ